MGLGIRKNASLRTVAEAVSRDASEAYAAWQRAAQHYRETGRDGARSRRLHDVWEKQRDTAGHLRRLAKLPEWVRPKRPAGGW